MNDPKVWLHGLMAAVIGAAASSISLSITDPVLFHDWSRLGKTVALTALVTAAAYLKQSPLPGGAK